MSITNPLWYRIPKYALLTGRDDYNQIYKVIGYHHTTNQFKLQRIGELECFYVPPEEVTPIEDPELLKELKGQFG